MTRPLGLLVEHGGEGLESRQIGVRVDGGLDLVLSIEEGWDVLIGAGELAQHIGRATAVFAEVELRIGRGGALKPINHRLIVGGVQAGQGGGVEGLELLQFGRRLRLIRRDARKRGV